MTLGERFDQLAERERRLLVIFVGILAALVLLLLPILIRMGVSEQAEANEKIRETIDSIMLERITIAKRKQVSERLTARYAKPAPALAGFLASTANKVGIEIPETSDRSVVPHGKTFKERQTRIRLNKVGMRKLAQFMEGITTAGYPVSITRLDIKKRGANPDEYDVEMDVSAFDREESKPKASAKSAEKTTKTTKVGKGEAEEP